MYCGNSYLNFNTYLPYNIINAYDSGQYTANPTQDYYNSILFGASGTIYTFGNSSVNENYKFLDRLKFK